MELTNAERDVLEIVVEQTLDKGGNPTAILPLDYCNRQVLSSLAREGLVKKTSSKCWGREIQGWQATAGGFAAYQDPYQEDAECVNGPR